MRFLKYFITLLFISSTLKASYNERKLEENNNDSINFYKASSELSFTCENIIFNDFWRELEKGKTLNSNATEILIERIYNYSSQIINNPAAFKSCKNKTELMFRFLKYPKVFDSENGAVTLISVLNSYVVLCDKNDDDNRRNAENYLLLTENPFIFKLAETNKEVEKYIRTSFCLNCQYLLSSERNDNNLGLTFKYLNKDEKKEYYKALFISSEKLEGNGLGLKVQRLIDLMELLIEESNHSSINLAPDDCFYIYGVYLSNLSNSKNYSNASRYALKALESKHFTSSAPIMTVLKEFIFEMVISNEFKDLNSSAISNYLTTLLEDAPQSKKNSHRKKLTQQELSERIKKDYFSKKFEEINLLKKQLISVREDELKNNCEKLNVNQAQKLEYLKILLEDLNNMIEKIEEYKSLKLDNIKPIVDLYHKITEGYELVKSIETTIFNEISKALTAKIKAKFLENQNNTPQILHPSPSINLKGEVMQAHSEKHEKVKTKGQLSTEKALNDVPSQRENIIGLQEEKEELNGIKSFKDSFTKALFITKCVGNFPVKTLEILELMHKFDTIDKLFENLPPGAKPEKLGNSSANEVYYSLRINNQYRIVFNTSPNAKGYEDVEATKHYK